MVALERWPPARRVAMLRTSNIQGRTSNTEQDTAQAQREIGGDGGFAGTRRTQQHEARMVGESFEDGYAAVCALGLFFANVGG